MVLMLAPPSTGTPESTPPASVPTTTSSSPQADGESPRTKRKTTLRRIDAPCQVEPTTTTVGAGRRARSAPADPWSAGVERDEFGSFGRCPRISEEAGGGEEVDHGDVAFEGAQKDGELGVGEGAAGVFQLDAGEGAGAVG